MTLLSLVLNGVLSLVFLFHIVDEGLEGSELFYWSLWVLPFLMNITVLWKKIRTDGLMERLIGTLSFIGSVAVFLVSVVVRVVNNEMSEIEFVVLSLTFITSLMTIMVLREYCPSVLTKGDKR
ncbi:MAG: hypothetical protein NZ842_17180 [Dehalococcoidia bacterium]|nr:hypothetical protein [Dehalococcoidia bacterium]MEE2766314.1 hypothetical protein [Pseudomonadota bacterium]